MSETLGPKNKNRPDGRCVITFLVMGSSCGVGVGVGVGAVVVWWRGGVDCSRRLDQT
jgi:hypothetical protein